MGSFLRGNSILSDIKFVPPSPHLLLRLVRILFLHSSSQTSPSTTIMSLTQEISLPNGIKYEQPLGLYVLFPLFYGGLLTVYCKVHQWRVRQRCRRQDLRDHQPSRRKSHYQCPRSYRKRCRYRCQGRSRGPQRSLETHHPHRARSPVDQARRSL